MVAILDLPIFPSVGIHIVYNASRQMGAKSSYYCQEISRLISLFSTDLVFNES